MQRLASDTSHIQYRGTSIQIAVTTMGDRAFGHADLFAQTKFKGRLSIGSDRCGADELRKKLESLAKAKVDILSAFECKARN